MSQTYIKDLAAHEGETVTLKGWLYNKRSSGKIHFLQVRDGTGLVQCVAGKWDLSGEQFAAVGRITQESSLTVTGKVSADKRAPGGFELQASAVELVHAAEEYPISPKEHGVDFLLNRRHLWLRSKRQHAILRIRDRVIKAIRDFLYDEGFVNLDTPIFTPAACEGTTTLFEAGYFDDKAYLAQSGQLYNEANAMAHGRVYCFGPTFRAEKSKTRRHLTEFWMVEPEIAFMEFDELLELVEAFVSYVAADVLAHCGQHLADLERDTAPIERIKAPFPRLSYSEAVERMNDEGHPFEWGGDFGAPDEELIASWFDRPVFVHRFPAAIKAFYMKRDPQDDRVVLGADLLAPEGAGEIIGASERADDLGFLEQQIEAHGLPKESFEWYLDLRRFGSAPHSGFGMGLERTVAWLAGVPHIRECIPFPRMLHRNYP